MFMPYVGDTLGLATNENHHVYQWSHPRCKVLFSVTRKGGGASCHFASDKAGLRYLKEAINEWTATCFANFDWCKMIIANSEKPSIQRLLGKLGFMAVLKTKDQIIMVRRY